MITVEQIKSSVFTSNTYVISGKHSDEVWLVDVGELEGVLQLLGEKQYIKGVFITHPHYDHIFEINNLLYRFPNCHVYSSDAGREGLFCSKLNLSKYHEVPIVFEGANIEVLKEGDSISLFKNYSLEVIATPGHDWSCLTFQVGDYLFTGDSYIPNVEVVTKLRGGDRDANRQSLEKIMNRFDEKTTICPGHGEMIKASILHPL